MSTNQTILANKSISCILGILFGFIVVIAGNTASAITQQELSELAKQQQGGKLSSRCDLSCETDTDKIMQDFWHWCSLGDRAILGDDLEVYAQKRMDACKTSLSLHKILNPTQKHNVKTQVIYGKTVNVRQLAILVPKSTAMVLELMSK